MFHRSPLYGVNPTSVYPTVTSSGGLYNLGLTDFLSILIIRVQEVGVIRMNFIYTRNIPLLSPPKSHQTNNFIASGCIEYGSPQHCTTKSNKEIINQRNDIFVPVDMHFITFLPRFPFNRDCRPSNCTKNRQSPWCQLCRHWCSAGCRNDNLLCRQRRQSWHHDNSWC